MNDEHEQNSGNPDANLVTNHNFVVGTHGYLSVTTCDQTQEVERSSLIGTYEGLTLLNVDPSWQPCRLADHSLVKFRISQPATLGIGAPKPVLWLFQFSQHHNVTQPCACGDHAMRELGR